MHLTDKVFKFILQNLIIEALMQIFRIMYSELNQIILFANWLLN
ncbi:hypothetical protein SALWKB2_2129 [Snodgrassella alvi wkB2]|nr:hypothetical protein SALWKB2_2129 [Snodgrassella alvi wkB2]